jgi:quercetin dioxygenase-like cupin family protein
VLGKVNTRVKINKIYSTINSEKVMPYIFVLPFIITFLVFFLYPIISALIMSFQDIKGPGDVTFIGLQNYRNLLNPHFYTALRVSFTYTFWTIAILIILPLILAVLLNNKLLRGRNIFRSALFMPALTSVIVAGMFFRYAFGGQATAIANQIRGIFGLGPITWLQGRSTGMIAMARILKRKEVKKMRSTVIIDPETMEWSSGSEDLPPGAMLKVVSSDEETGAVAAIVKFPAGYVEPKHGHPCGHDILIIQGKLVNPESGQEISKGMYFYAPKGDIHGPLQVPKEEDCIFFVVTDGPLFPLLKQ